MTFSPMLVILVTAVVTLGIIFYLEREKRQKKIDKAEGVVFFGEKITTQDYFSFCNTVIAYLMISDPKRIDLSKFIAREKIESENGKESMRMIEQTINLFPIISCTWEKDGILYVNEEETIKKTAEYQKTTKSDDYLLPLFDVGLIARAAGLFNTSTRYQQAKTVENILTTKGVGDQFECTDDILKGLSKITFNKGYKAPDVMYSNRNIQAV